MFAGRLLRFSDLSFQAAIRRYFLGHVSATHFFAPAEVRAALAQASGGSLTLTDLLGDRVSLAANDELAIDLERPGQIRATFPRERFSDQAAARAAVEQQGGQVIEAPGDAVDPKSLDLVVTFPPERRDQALHADAKSQALPVAQIQGIATLAGVQIPDDALILLEGERPREHLKSLIIAVFLLGFAVVNLLALRRRGNS